MATITFINSTVILPNDNYDNHAIAIAKTTVLGTKDILSNNDDINGSQMIITEPTNQ